MSEPRLGLRLSGDDETADDTDHPMVYLDPNDPANPVLTQEYKDRCRASEAPKGASALKRLAQDLKDSRSPLKQRLASSIANIIAFKHALYTSKSKPIAKDLLDAQFKYLNEVCSYGKITGDIYYTDANGDIQTYKLLELQKDYKRLYDTLTAIQKTLLQVSLTEQYEKPDTEHAEYANAPEAQKAILENHRVIAEYLDRKGTELKAKIEQLGLDSTFWNAQPWLNFLGAGSDYVAAAEAKREAIGEKRQAKARQAKKGAPLNSAIRNLVPDEIKGVNRNAFVCDLINASDWSKFYTCDRYEGTYKQKDAAEDEYPNPKDIDFFNATYGKIPILSGKVKSMNELYANFAKSFQKGGGDEDELLSLVDVGLARLNPEALSNWLHYVNLLEQILDTYGAKLQNAKELGEELVARTREPRWKHLFNASNQCEDFSNRFVGFETNPSFNELKETQAAFFTSLEEFNSLQEIIQQINILKTDLGIKYRVLLIKRDDANRIISTDAISARDWNEDKLKQGTHFVDLMGRDLTKIINRIDNVLVAKIEEADSKLKGFSRDNVKEMMADMVRNFARSWSQFVTGYINFYITGPAGSGKTTIAKAIGPILASMGILVFGKFNIESRATLVGEYVGQTATKTRSKLIKALENVMFIDEAYAVAKGGGGSSRFDSFGREALDEIVGFLDKHQGEMSLIVAGYKCDMEQYFMKVNEGLTRRFPAKYQIDLQRLCPIDFWATFSGEILEKVKFDKPDATVETILDSGAIDVINAIFYSGTEIPGKDRTNGQFTFRHLLQNENSDAVELAQEMSNLYFRKNMRQVTADDAIPVLLKWLKTRDGSAEKSATFYDIPRSEENCEPVNYYKNVTMNDAQIKRDENWLASLYGVSFTLPPPYTTIEETAQAVEASSNIAAPTQPGAAAALEEELSKIGQTFGATPRPSVAETQFGEQERAAPAAGTTQGQLIANMDMSAATELAKQVSLGEITLDDDQKRALKEKLWPKFAGKKKAQVPKYFSGL